MRGRGFVYALTDEDCFRSPRAFLPQQSNNSSKNENGTPPMTECRLRIGKAYEMAEP
jgi:hypothetical protein